jgi:hypothetical protein
LQSYEITPTAFVVWLPSLYQRKNKARARSSIVKTVGSSLEEAISETHLRVGKAQEQSTELPDQENLGPYNSIIARSSNEN